MEYWGRFRAAVVAAAGVTALYMADTRAGVARGVVANLATTVVALVVGAACIVAARHKAARYRRSWLLFGAASLSWGAGDVVWTYFETVLGREVPFPSLADAGYLLAVPLAAAAMLSYPARSSGVSRVRAVVDGLIIATALLFVSWSLVLGPTIDSASGSVLAQVIGLAYPAGDVVLGAVALLAVSHSPRGERRPLVLVAAGLLALAVADTGFAYLTLNDAYLTGHLIDLGWLAGWLFVGLAALCPVGDQQGEVTYSGRVGLFAPYLAVVAMVAVAVHDRVTAGTLSPIPFALLIVTVALIIVRQVLTLAENAALTRHLEAKVEARTVELRLREERFRSLVQRSSDVVTVLDTDALVQYQSDSVQDVFGYDPRSLVGRSLAEAFHRDDREHLRAVLQEVAGEPGGRRTVEARVRHAGGDWRDTETTLTNLLDDPSVNGLVLNTRDISERRALEKELRHQAFHDSLTGLANRALFRDRLEHALARMTRADHALGVLFLDLDGFKAVNDSLGHAAGDELLVEVGGRLRATLRPADTIARLGGDEFALLVEGVDDATGLEVLAERVLAAVREPSALRGQEVVVHASVGITMATSPHDSADELLRNADVAMYMAKSRGKNRHEMFESSMHEAARERLERETDLRRAIDRGELDVYYQPTVSLATGRVSGVEALVRWHRPGHGLVPPAEFIPLAEETGLVVALGSWVLRQACTQAREWQDLLGAAAPSAVNVNLSARQLQQPELAAEVAEVLADTGLDPSHLVLEITESVLMVDSDAMVGRLRQLKDLGIRLAIDDFGTGYSSLSYLQRFPFDILKIDRSFVDGLGRGGEERALVRTIIAIGETFNMSSVAEGIEREEQVALLRELGCPVGQGYLFARPEPAELVTRRLLESAPAVYAT